MEYFFSFVLLYQNILIITMRNYHKKPKIDIEEVLMDRRALNKENEVLEKLETPVETKNIFFVFLSIMVCVIILYGRVFYLDIIKGQFFYQLSETNRLRYTPIKAPRGIIFDRYGKALVENKMTLSLILSPQDLFSNTNKDNLITEVANIFGLSSEDIQKKYTHLNSFSFEPILLKTNISTDEARIFESEIKEEDRKGFYLVEDYSRRYVDPEAFSHILGYIGKMDEEDVANNPEYPISDVLGKMGLEKYYEKYLHGTSGKKLIEVDAKAHMNPNLGEESPQAGNNIYTTIDKDMQIELYKDLSNAVKGLGIHKAAGLIINPKTGEVLSLVSLPAIDVNVLTNGSPKKTIEAMMTDKYMPFINRIISGLYAPGSTIKPLVAMAALEEKTVDPNKKIVDEDALIVPNPYDPEHPATFRDWRNHGIVDMRSAIANSCNIYFYSLGGGYKDIKGLGIKKIKEYWIKFHLAKSLGIDLFGEKDGVLPDPEWKKKNNKTDPTWYLGDTYNISIGQGDLFITPIQIAYYLASIANKGDIMKPYIVSKIMDEKNAIVYKANSKVIENINMSSENFQVVLEGMRGVITIGSAKMLNNISDKFQVAGKTGTPQTEGGKKTNAFFVAFAPYEDPEVLMLVLLEEPPQGSVAAIPVVDQLMRWYYNNRFIKGL